MGANYEQSSKKCISQCPNCGEEDGEKIDWGLYDGDEDFMCQRNVCMTCGCRFTEYFHYHDTEWVMGGIDDDCPRIKCPYPYSDFYTYMDEIPQGTRVSVPEEDCAKCDDEDCEEKYCLIHDCGPTDPAVVACRMIINALDADENASAKELVDAIDWEMVRKAVE